MFAWLSPSLHEAQRLPQVNSLKTPPTDGTPLPLVLLCFGDLLGSISIRHGSNLAQLTTTQAAHRIEPYSEDPGNDGAGNAA